MTSKHLRILSLFCCVAAIVVAALGLYGFQLRAEWFAQLGGVEASAPEFTTRALYIAGLLMALRGCFHLKAHGEPRQENEEGMEMSDES